MVDIPGSDKKLIHTPTMRAPSAIADPLVVYRCMRTTLMCALNNRVESIVIPAFGGATGNVPYCSIAALMKEAYDQVMNPPKSLNWEYANRYLEDRFREM